MGQLAAPAVGEEREGAAIGAPAGPAIVVVARGEGARSASGLHHPQIRELLLRLTVDPFQHIHHALPIRRDAEVLDQPESVQILRGDTSCPRHTSSSHCASITNLCRSRSVYHAKRGSGERAARSKGQVARSLKLEVGSWLICRLSTVNCQLLLPTSCLPTARYPLL